ncbi:MAG: Spy/CpxP family protein refolding chaperone [bacterium]
MKRLACLAMGVALVAALQVFAQESEEPKQDDRRPPRRGEQGRDEMLTAEQTAKVTAILSKYDPNTLTADQAKAIHEAFRKAGLWGGSAMCDAIKAAGFDPDKLRDLAPPPGQKGRPDRRSSGSGQGEMRPERGGGDDQRPLQDGEEPPARPDGNASAKKGGHGQGNYSLDQAISDRAQLSTIAFSGLAFLTGDFGGATFMPPGKVCDYFGFQYMRDIDAAGKGHNPMFLSRVAANVMHILNEGQRKMFEDLAAEQAPQFEQLALKRMPLIKAFHRERDGDIPPGTTGLSRDAIIRYVGDFYAYDAELSYRRAEVFGKVVTSLTPDQKAYLGKMKFGDFNTWPEMDERSALKRQASGVSKFYNVAYMTYASEFFSWTAGSITADVYFCPERHGTYFGGFYMKDMPAMGKRNYDISTAVTGDSGENFLNLLNVEQRANITSITELQKKPLAEMVEVRTAMSSELRKFLGGGQADKLKVLALGRRYGELDGEMSWMYAMAFAKVNRTLMPEQRAAMNKLRNLDGYQSAPAFLYSSPMQTLPEIQNTDFLFGVSATTQPAPTAGMGKSVNAKTGFVLKSSAVTDGGQLPKEFTGDGASATLPLEWSGEPAGTKSFAVIMHHIDPQGKTKWYRILYNIPPATRSLPKNVKDVGVLGNNSVNGRIGYAPPHSKGPGPKTYVYTVYALSENPKISVAPDQVSREVLLAAMRDQILATAEMKVVYSRSVGDTLQSGLPDQLHTN